MKNIAILGGSFNPPHIGHFRMAYEVMEQMAPDSLLFVPCARPPHKKEEMLLPFDFRVMLLEKTIQPNGKSISISTVENERKERSYTVDTLRILKDSYPHSRFMFIMGSDDLKTLHLWKEWEKITSLADLVVLQRACYSKETFLKQVKKLWPKAEQKVSLLKTAPLCYIVNDQEYLHLLSHPVLDISSSSIRARWISGKSIQFLVPDVVDMELKRNSSLVTSTWVVNEEEKNT